jgi:hypothetical protein
LVSCPLSTGMTAFGRILFWISMLSSHGLENRFSML